MNTFRLRVNEDSPYMPNLFAGSLTNCQTESCGHFLFSLEHDPYLLNRPYFSNTSSCPVVQLLLFYPCLYFLVSNFYQKKLHFLSAVKPPYCLKSRIRNPYSRIYESKYRIQNPEVRMENMTAEYCYPPTNKNLEAGVQDKREGIKTPAKCFADLMVWQEEQYCLTSQLRRYAVSIPANIAEGFKKRGKGDKVRFFNIAQGSLEEWQ